MTRGFLPICWAGDTVAGAGLGESVNSLGLLALNPESEKAQKADGFCSGYRGLYLRSTLCRGRSMVGRGMEKNVFLWVFEIWNKGMGGFQVQVGLLPVVTGVFGLRVRVRGG